jgi:hypothetical protein
MDDGRLIIQCRSLFVGCWSSVVSYQPITSRRHHADAFSWRAALLQNGASMLADSEEQVGMQQPCFGCHIS